jgi:hypothetical protein
MIRINRGKIPPLTLEEQKQWQQAIADAKRLQAELLTQRGGELLPDSGELINQARDARTRDLMSAVEG